MAVDLCSTELIAFRLKKRLADGEEQARAFLESLTHTEADSLGRCLKRLGWWLPDDGRSIQELIVWWLFRDDVMCLEFVDGQECQRLETPQERASHFFEAIMGMVRAATVPAESCLAVARFVRRAKLFVENKPFKTLPLGMSERRCGFPHGFMKFDVSDIRFDGECLSDSLNAAAKQLGLPPGVMMWQKPTGHWATTEQRAWADVRGMLDGWIGVLEREIQSRGELPPGWEPNGTAWPEWTIRDVEELRAWLAAWLQGLVDARSTTSQWASRPESYLDDFRRELRNTRRALRAWGVSLPAGFDDNPADIHEAERQLELLIHNLSKPAAEKQPEVIGGSLSATLPLVDDARDIRPTILTHLNLIGLANPVTQSAGSTDVNPTLATDGISNIQKTPLNSGQKTLRPCDIKAGSQYNKAMSENPELKTYQEAYDWYNKHLLDENETHPSFATWGKYVRKYRAASGLQKNRRGVGHETRSVVKITNLK